jgi:hypothetical protein
VKTIDLDSSAKMLRAKREELLDQLDTIDRALAALVSEEITVANTRGLHTEATAVEDTTSPVVPTRVKPRRVLSDEHRQALIEGGRKARHSRDAAAGRAREMPNPSPGLALASKATGLPRLVKREKTLVREAMRTAGGRPAPWSHGRKGSCVP